MAGVLSDAGRPVAMARVTLFTRDLTFFREARSTTMGRFAQENLPSGI
jgi:hypothetical protein